MKEPDLKCVGRTTTENGGQLPLLSSIVQSLTLPAQQGLRRGRVVKLQFISVDTEAQETGEPPCLPPKRLLTIGVSFPRPLTPHSHPRLSPPCCLQKLVPHSSHPHAPIPGPLHVLSSRKVLPTTTPGPPRLQRGYPDGHIYSCLLISRVTLHTCSHVTL